MQTVVPESAQTKTYPRGSGPLHMLLPSHMPPLGLLSLHSSLRPGGGREHGSQEELGSRKVNCEVGRGGEG